MSYTRVANRRHSSVPRNADLCFLNTDVGWGSLGRYLDVGGYDAVADDFARAVAEARVLNEVADHERCHDERVRGRPCVQILCQLSFRKGWFSLGTHRIPCLLLLPGVVGRLLAGHKGSVALRGTHMGKPENEQTLGFWSSAVNKGAAV